MFLSQAFRLRRSRRRQHTPWAYQMLTLCLMRVRAVLIQIAFASAGLSTSSANDANCLSELG